MKNSVNWDFKIRAYEGEHLEQNITLEDMYKAFKERLIDDLKASSPELLSNADLIDTSQDNEDTIITCY